MIKGNDNDKQKERERQRGKVTKHNSHIVHMIIMIITTIITVIDAIVSNIFYEGEGEDEKIIDQFSLSHCSTAFSIHLLTSASAIKVTIDKYEWKMVCNFGKILNLIFEISSCQILNQKVVNFA